MKNDACFIDIEINLLVPINRMTKKGTIKPIAKKICQIQVTNEVLHGLLIFKELIVDGIHCNFRSELSSNVGINENVNYIFNSLPKPFDKKEMMRLIDCGWKIFPQAIKQYQLVSNREGGWLKTVIEKQRQTNKAKKK